MQLASFTVALLAALSSATCSESESSQSFNSHDDYRPYDYDYDSYGPYSYSSYGKSPYNNRYYNSYDDFDERPYGGSGSAGCCKAKRPFYDSYDSDSEDDYGYSGYDSVDSYARNLINSYTSYANDVVDKADRYAKSETAKHRLQDFDGSHFSVARPQKRGPIKQSRVAAPPPPPLAAEFEVKPTRTDGRFYDERDNNPNWKANNPYAHCKWPAETEFLDTPEYQAMPAICKKELIWQQVLIDERRQRFFTGYDFTGFFEQDMNLSYD